MKTLNLKSADEVAQGVKGIEKFLTQVISFTELQESIHSATLKILENYQVEDEFDADTRPYQLALEAKQMLDCLRPFAIALGQIK